MGGELQLLVCIQPLEDIFLTLLQGLLVIRTLLVRQGEATVSVPLRALHAWGDVDVMPWWCPGRVTQHVLELGIAAGLPWSDYMSFNLLGYLANCPFLGECCLGLVLLAQGYVVHQCLLLLMQQLVLLLRVIQLLLEFCGLRAAGFTSFLGFKASLSSSSCAWSASACISLVLALSFV